MTIDQGHTPRLARQRVASIAGWIIRLPAGRVGKWLVLGGWLVIALALTPLAQRLTSVQQDDTAGWLPRSAEATRAYQRAQASFPESRTTPAVVVYARDGGLTGTDLAKVTADRDALAGYGWQGQAGPVIPAADGSAVLYTVPVPGTGTEDRQRLLDTVNGIRDRARSGASPGLRVGVAGPAASAADFADTFAGMDVTLLVTTVGVVALVLLATYRSPVLWLVPLVSVGVASQLAEGLTYVLARYAGLTVSGQNAGILTVLVFGAGTDYALLLIARYREELHRHRDRHAAMAVALRRSVPAICASGTTVMLGMLCLLAARMNATRGLGPVAAIGIAVALLVMTTLLPALLVICGRWLFWPFVPAFRPASDAGRTGGHGLWARLAGLVGRHPRPLWIGTAAALVALAAGSLTLHVTSRQEDNFTRTVSSVTAQHLLTAHFPAGSSAPAMIVTAARAADAVATAARQVPGVASVATSRPSPDGDWVLLDAVLRDAPDSPAAARTIERLRAAVHAVPGSRSLVGGATATQVDIERAVDHDNRVVIPLILAMVLIVLVLLLRALVAAVLLTASVVVSFLGSMGAAALVFAALGRTGVYSILPLYGFLFLVALGVDYTIFLMSRAREETARIGHRAGTLRALTVTGGVITSAGVLLAATFGVLTVMPLTFMLHLGLLIAIGVLFDTLAVRTLLVPALALDLGGRIWWPSRLARGGRPRPVGHPPLAPAEPELSLVG